ncbi:MAG: hypothetical protein LUE29_09675 [Lachnospiraceae bacterium]|nr:hypothetical protein [Lachnospiraceae bacterium]
MKREDFVAGLNSQLEMSVDEQADILYESLKQDGETLTSIIAIEELAELQKEISKQLRGEGNFYDLLQEMADVDISLANLMVMHDISSSELRKVMTVKIDREKKRIGR